MTRLASQHLNCCNALLLGLVCQHGPLDHVTNSVYALDVGCKMVIHFHHTARAHLHSHVLKTESFCVGHTASGHQHIVCLHLLLCAALHWLCGQHNAGVGDFSTHDLGGQLELDALLLQHVLEGLSALGINARGDAVEELHSGHLRSKTVPN